MFSQTTIIGHVGMDADVRFLQDASSVITFNVAHSERWKDKHGEQQERTTWFRCSWFTDKTPLADYLRKGTLVCVQGRVAANAYLDKSGNPGASLEIRVDNVRFLSKPNQDNAPYGQQTAQTATPVQSEPTAPALPQPQEPGDDLPF